MQHASKTISSWYVWYNTKAEYGHSQFLYISLPQLESLTNNRGFATCRTSFCHLNNIKAKNIFHY